jgi:alkanesulfonate monooxygenase SsuD/methylene tetrahydromethanopterin reductase-like flavin-dependent oxidoreductase (luciferase family)
MHFGLFLEQMRQGIDQPTAFRELFETADAAEAWGVDGLWLAEMHFNPTRSVQSFALGLNCAIAMRTRRVRLGTAVQLLPLNHPLRVAGEVATLDQISGGRFDFGIGRSGGPRSYDIYGVSYGESQRRFFEALDVILQAWKGETFDHDGEFFKFKNATVAPRPLQEPHPPLRMAATNDETFPVVGRMGLQVFVGLRGMDIAELRGHLENYRTSWRQAHHPGEPNVYLRIPVYASTTEAGAREEPRETTMHYFNRQADLTRFGIGRSDTGSAERRERRSQDLKALSYDDILEKRVAYGGPEGLTERLRWLRDELSLDGIVAELNPAGYLPHELVMRSLRIITHEVLPNLK